MYCQKNIRLSIIRELKQPRRRRQQKPHKFAYLTIKNSIFACFARAFFIFWHFARTFSFFLRREMTCFAVMWTTWAYDDKCRDANLSRTKKSGDFSFLTPRNRATSPPPPKKKAIIPPPLQIDPHTPKSTSCVHLNLTAWKKKVSEVFRGLPKLNQSWTEVYRRFSDVGPEN